MSPGRRFLSFRDFDWGLLGMVLVLCTISVLEIYSATLHTKYAEPPHQAAFLHRRRPGGHVHLLAKIDYHKLIDWAPWAYGSSWSR